MQNRNQGKWEENGLKHVQNVIHVCQTVDVRVKGDDKSRNDGDGASEGDAFKPRPL